MHSQDAVSDRPRGTASHGGWCTVAALALLASAGCSEPTVEQLNGPVSVSIAPRLVSLFVGGVATLTAEALDAKRAKVAVSFTWASTNPAVATVSSGGVVTAIGPGITSVTADAGALRASATVQVEFPPVAIFFWPGDMVLTAGEVDRFTAYTIDVLGRTSNVLFEWSSANPAIARVGKSDGVVTAIAVGTTTVTAAVGALRATVSVTVEPQNYLAQWASGASASTQYTDGEWSAAQATGAPNVTACADDGFAWASAEPDVDWLEVTYAQPVRPTKIHIYEGYAVGSIVQVEVKDEAGKYHSVYSALPDVVVSCSRILEVKVTNVTAKVAAVRITVDQRARGDWTEIDAVRLTGHR